MGKLATLALGLVFICTGAARGGFIGELETFDGTSKDAATWVEYVNRGSTITQNDALFLNAGSGGNPDYTTKIAPITAGGYVEAQLTVNSFVFTEGQSANAWIALSTDSGGTANGAPFDTRYISLEYDVYPYPVPGPSPSFLMLDLTNGGGSGHYLQPVASAPMN